jgi:O-acetyl-ADP-ribose deacetylase (regulator of RNase III)
MMAKIKLIENGNIFDSKCEILVNPVNTQGIMGKGLALEFKKRFPNNFNFYKRGCEEGYFVLYPIITASIDDDLLVEQGKVILNFKTKEKWCNPSKIEYIKEGMEQLVEWMQIYEFPQSIAIPALGCGLGGLAWKDVKKVIYDYLLFLDDDIYVEIYEPFKK